MAIETDPAAPHPTDEHAGAPASSAGQHGATTEAAHGSGGLPQFEFQHWGGQIAYLLILFAVLYLLVSKIFAPRIRRIFDEREKMISGALGSARQVQAEADAQAAAVKAEIEEARSGARRLAADAKAKAQAELAASQAAEDARLQAELDKAEERIRGMRDKAMANVGEIAAETAEAIVAKLTGAKPSKAELNAALKARSPEGVA